MFQAMKKYWWLILLRGIVAVLFGIYTLVYPGISATAMVLAFGIFAVVSGAITLGMALSSRGNSDDRVMLGVQGVVQALFGVLVLAWPGISMLALLWAIIIFAFAGGVVEIVAALQDRDVWLGLSGLISVLFGIYAFRFPAEGALALVSAIGIYAIGVGVMLIIGSFQVRKVGDALAPTTRHSH
jgi:uncharacterized membrane protein HdeD (DUF308 family)